MKHIVILLFFVTVLFFPAYGQSEKNPSLVVQTIEIPYDDFSKVARDSIIVGLEKPHKISWQIIIYNELAYANPDGNAVLRFYDVNIPAKFIEIGMGSHPDNKFWLAVNMPGDTEYVVIHSKQERGWIPGAAAVLAYTERAGLTVNNGERIVVSNLNVKGFEIGSYSVYGMESSTDPPATYAGSLTLELMSGDPAKNQLHLLPFFLVGGIGVIIALLLVTKKRS